MSDCIRLQITIVLCYSLKLYAIAIAMSTAITNNKKKRNALANFEPLVRAVSRGCIG